jgi:TRAP-type mannitol/chloroaromatic compound transport system permease small subunit
VRVIASIVRALSGINWLIGNVFSWLALAIVIVCFTVVVQRYAFATTRLWMQDLYVWLNGAMFTAVAGFALLRNDHVRVDIFYRPASIRHKAVIDLIGVIIFLLPFAWIIYAYGWNFVARSWRIHEGSPNPGGLYGYYILKGFILAFAALIALQGLAMALRSVLVLTRNEALLPEHLRYQRDEEPGPEAIL